MVDVLTMLSWFRQDDPDRRFAAGRRAFERGRYAEAAFAWKNAAARDHAEAAARLGDMYSDGTGVLRSMADAKHWYSVAAERGIARAQARLAELCLSDGGSAATSTASGVLAALCPNGVTLKRDDAMARRWALAAAEQGDASGQALIGYLLASGRGGEPDYVQAAHWYRMAAEYGVARAQLGLGTLLAGRLLGEPCYEAAFEWFSKAAEQGNGTAMYYVGVLHQQGLGRAADKSQAVACFRRAAEAGCVEGQRCLGKAYLEGDGTPRDPISAEAWLRKAARAGDVDAMGSLGDLYAHDGANIAEAMEWYRAAADHGHKGARLMIDRINARQPGGQPAAKSASPDQASASHVTQVGR